MSYIPDALRLIVIERANWRCEYCRLHQNHCYFTHEIDHIYAEKHGGETLASNLCLACSICNKHKRSNLCSLDPQTGDVIVLFHPRKDNWDDHFRITDTGVIEPLTPQERVTECVLGFNQPELVADRLRLMALGNYQD